MLSALNALPNSEAFDLLYKVCSSRVWTNAMVAHRPFQSLEHMQTQAALLDQQLNQDDWLEAFAGHPMIGRPKEQQQSLKEWEATEQRGTSEASKSTLDELENLNQQYLATFGYIYIVCATGKSADEMLEILKSRLRHRAQEELWIAAKEQSAITQLRLAKLLHRC